MFGAIVRRPGNKRGFTLIELLVVIAIIAILAAILFPVFAKARENATLTRCLAHLSQIGKAVQAYVDDNDGRFPIGPDTSTIAGSGGYWTSQYFAGGDKGHDPSGKGIDPKLRPLYKYTSGNLGIWKCPDELKKSTESSYWEFGNSYVINALADSKVYGGTSKVAYYCLLGPGDQSYDTYTRPAPRKSSEVSRPTKIWMVGERPLHDPWKQAWEPGSKHHLAHGKDKPFSPVVFCDGHTGTIWVNDDLYDKNGRWGYFEVSWWKAHTSGNPGI